MFIKIKHVAKSLYGFKYCRTPNFKNFQSIQTHLYLERIAGKFSNVVCRTILGSIRGKGCWRSVGKEKIDWKLCLRNLLVILKRKNVIFIE